MEINILLPFSNYIAVPNYLQRPKFQGIHEFLERSCEFANSLKIFREFEKYLKFNDTYSQSRFFFFYPRELDLCNLKLEVVQTKSAPLLYHNRLFRNRRSSVLNRQIFLQDRHKMQDRCSQCEITTPLYLSLGVKNLARGVEFFRPPLQDFHSPINLTINVYLVSICGVSNIN